MRVRIRLRGVRVRACVETVMFHTSQPNINCNWMGNYCYGRIQARQGQSSWKGYAFVRGFRLVRVRVRVWVRVKVRVRVRGSVTIIVEKMF